MYASYKNDVEFLIVYIREAHPNLLKRDDRTPVKNRPKDIGERVILATECVMRYKFTMPMVIDGMEGKVNSDYQAWPVRITIVDVDGKTVFYGGKGPGDFKIPPAEKVLKKLAANGGRVPPAPKPEWGEPVGGLRLGLSIEPERFTAGEDVTVQVQFENTGNEPIFFCYEPEIVAAAIVLNGSNGDVLKLKASTPQQQARGRGRNPRANRPVKRIAQGQKFTADIEGQFAAYEEKPAFTVGQFAAACKLAVDDEALAKLDETDREGVWTGTLLSGNFTVTLDLPRKAGCSECHAGDDFHHKTAADCAACHVGVMGAEVFGVDTKTCVQCHPRKGFFGRRTILGSEGEFALASRHISDKPETKDCLLCHDDSRHGDGAISLKDPQKGQPWTGTMAEFCLTCHDGDPPQGVTFPEESSGSGYDKSAFRNLPYAKWTADAGCTLCHAPHGSEHPALLRNMDLAQLKGIHSSKQ